MVNLLIVIVHFHIWKKWMQYVVCIGNSSYFFLFFFVICSFFSGNNRLIFLLRYLSLTLVCIVTTSFDKLKLQCRKKLSQIKVRVPIRMKFKLYAILIKWGKWKNFLFLRGQDIVNNRDYPSKICRHCHKRLVPKIAVWHDQLQVFFKMSLHDRLDCLVAFVGMILLCLGPPCLAYASSLPPTAPFRLRLPSSNYFFRVCFPTHFAADLNDFLPLITSAISGVANSNMSTSMRFAAGTIYLRKNGIVVLPITCGRAPNPLSLCLPTPL